MLEFIHILAFAIIAIGLKVSVLDAKDITHSEYLLQYPSHQSCDNAKQNETQAKLERLLIQQTAIQNQIEGQQTALKESWKKLISESIEDRLDRMESKLATVNSQLSDIQKTLRDIKMSLEKVNKNPPKFEQIGSKYIYIEHNDKLKWASASRKCELMGGYLAYNFSEKEFIELNLRLNPSIPYFLGINDIDEKGVFITGPTGKRAPFFKWKPGEPVSQNQEQHCASVHEGGMLLDNCNLIRNFICQADA